MFDDKGVPVHLVAGVLQAAALWDEIRMLQFPGPDGRAGIDLVPGVVGQRFERDDGMAFPGSGGFGKPTIGQCCEGFVPCAYEEEEGLPVRHRQVLHSAEDG